MTLFQGVGILLSLIAVFGLLNQRFLKLPDTPGITAVGLIVSLCFLMASYGNPGLVVAMP